LFRHVVYKRVAFMSGSYREQMLTAGFQKPPQFAGNRIAGRRLRKATLCEPRTAAPGRALCVLNGAT
jgi:hypothetical protein